MKCLFQNNVCGDSPMNVLFLTLVDIRSINEQTIYTDLLRESIHRGDHVYIVSPSERRNGERTRILQENDCVILRYQLK
jgi:hypothetical protein